LWTIWFKLNLHGHKSEGGNGNAKKRITKRTNQILAKKSFQPFSGYHMLNLNKIKQEKKEN